MNFRWKPLFSVGLLALLGVLLSAASAKADTWTYQFTGTGDLNGTDFTLTTTSPLGFSTTNLLTSPNVTVSSITDVHFVGVDSGMMTGLNFQLEDCDLFGITSCTQVGVLNIMYPAFVPVNCPLCPTLVDVPVVFYGAGASDPLLSLVTPGTYVGAAQPANGDLVISGIVATPEPGTISLMLIGLVGLGILAAVSKRKPLGQALVS